MVVASSCEAASATEGRYTAVKASLMFPENWTTRLKSENQLVIEKEFNVLSAGRLSFDYREKTSLHVK